MLEQAIANSGGARQAQAEEERMLMQAIEESKYAHEAQPSDPNNPDVDNMTYD